MSVTSRSRTASLLRDGRKVPILNDRSHLEKGGCHHRGVICLWEKSHEISRRERSHLSLMGRACRIPFPSLSSRTRLLWGGQKLVTLLRLWHGETWQGLRIATPACTAHELLHGQVFPCLNDEPGGMLITPTCP